MMHTKNMRFIGITGGVGAGKSAILSYLAQKPKTKVMLADEIAHKLMEPGTGCYRKIVEQFAGLDIFVEQMCENTCSVEEINDDFERQVLDGQLEVNLEEVVFGSQQESDSKNVNLGKVRKRDLENRGFDRGKLAQVIFSDPKKREEMNAIVHPAVKAYVRQQYAVEQEKGELDLLVLEAALLIEEEYDEICDELWYIYTSEENRRKRLKDSRGYSDEKIENIFRSQLSEAEFRQSTQVTIDNNGDLGETMNQIEKALRRKADE